MAADPRPPMAESDVLRRAAELLAEGRSAVWTRDFPELHHDGDPEVCLRVFANLALEGWVVLDSSGAHILRVLAGGHRRLAEGT
ncbi:MAG TPA: hypothetical protein VGL20_21045 [Candidatus Dormibacteraeota bacterium]